MWLTGEGRGGRGEWVGNGMLGATLSHQVHGCRGSMGAGCWGDANQSKRFQHQWALQYFEASPCWWCSLKCKASVG